MGQNRQAEKMHRRAQKVEGKLQRLQETIRIWDELGRKHDRKITNELCLQHIRKELAK